MKQKIVIKMQLQNDKCRSKAMCIACKRHGLSSVAITGEGRDQVEVVGDGIDSAELTRAMRKKVCTHACLVLVEEVKPKEKDKAKEDPIKVPQAQIQGYPCTSYYQYPPYQYMCECNPSPPICSIL